MFLLDVVRDMMLLTGGGNVALGGDALKVVHGNYNIGLGIYRLAMILRVVVEM